MTTEEILDSENYWKHDFEIKLISINKDKVEWWIITYLETKNSVSCTSMLQAFKIAYLSEERLDLGYIKSKFGKLTERKAGILLYGNTLQTTHRLNGDMYYNRSWHNKRKSHI